MMILLKYLLHDMLVQYRRTLLVLVTLTLSAASMLASVAVSDTMVALGTNEWRAEYGYSDILVTASPASPSRFFSELACERYGGACEYRVLRASASAGILKDKGSVAVNAVGYDITDLMKMVPLHFAGERNLLPFEGNKAVISRKTAAALAIGIGDIIFVEICGNRHAFEICAIAYAEGPFASEPDSPALLLPRAKLQAAVGELGRVDAVFLKLRDPAAKGRVIRALSTTYPLYWVKESYSADQIRLQANRTSVPFVFMSVLLCFMAVYVLYTIFKGAVADRGKLMGLFRAVGATGWDTWAVLTAESLLYGLIGGLMSWAAGAGMLWIVARMLHEASSYRYLSLAIGPLQLLLALLCAVVTSLMGVLACMVSGGSHSISRQMKGVLPFSEANRYHAAGGLGLGAASLAVLLLWRGEAGLAVYITCVVGMLLSMALLAPALCRRAAKLMNAAAGRLSGVWRIALVNIKSRRDFTVSATITAIIVTTIVVISTITSSDQRGLDDYFGRQQYGLEFSMPGINREALNRVRQMKGIDGVCANYYSPSVEVAGQAIPIYRIQGVTAEHARYTDYRVMSSLPDPFAALEAGRNMLLTRTLQAIYGAGEGDTLVLRLYARGGKYKEVPYTVVGFFDNYITKLGRFALISQRSFEDSFGLQDYTSLYVKAGDARAAAEALEAAYFDRVTSARIVSDARAESEKESAQIIAAMMFISILAAVTGILGIVNITLLSFMRRKREIGLDFAIGMTAGDILRTTLAEQTFSGLMGAAAGLIMGFLITALALPRLIDALQIAIRIYPDARCYLLGFASGLSACILSAVFSLLFLRRSNPMDGLRQEE